MAQRNVLFAFAVGLAATMAACGDDGEGGVCGLSGQEVDEIVETDFLFFTAPFMQRLGQEILRDIEVNKVPDPSSTNQPCSRGGSQQWSFEGNEADPASGPYTNTITLDRCDQGRVIISNDVAFSGNRPVDGSTAVYSGEVKISLSGPDGCFVEWLRENWVDVPCSIDGTSAFEGFTTVNLDCPSKGSWTFDVD